MATPFPTIEVAQSSTRTTKRDLSVVSFGNGYEQRVPMGLNYQRYYWNVTWENKSATEKNTLVAFLQAIGNGSTTTWTDPFSGVVLKYVLDGDWTLSDNGGNVYTITATFKQVFDLA